MKPFLNKIASYWLVVLICLLGIQGVAGKCNPPDPFMPTLIGEDTVCSGLFEYIYVTDPGMTNYDWTVEGGTIVTGGNSSSNMVKVVWGTITPQYVSVTYTEATGTTTLNIFVIESLPVSVTISTVNDTVCDGETVIFTASPSNPGILPVYAWKVNAFNVGTNSPVYSYIPNNGDIVTCQLTSGLPCTTGSPAISNTIVMTVIENLPVNVTISTTANPVCQGTSVTFTANPFNGGSTPSYQWKVNGLNVGGNSPTYSYTPIHGDIVTCVMNSTLPCTSGNPATSNMVTMTVSPFETVSITILASANPTCMGNPVVFSAAGVNGGASPVYEWKVNGVNAGTNSTTYTYTPTDNDIITCTLTSSIGCPIGNPSVSNTITMEVETYTLVGIAISASANPICQGSLVNYTATPVNGGSTPAYQWMINGLPMGSNNPSYSFVPDNGDVVACYLTSSLLCTNGNPATSNTITMMVSPSLPAGVAIATASNPSCQGLAVTFTATPSNGGSSPSYAWKVNGIPAGTNSHLFTYVPVNGDVIQCEMTSSNPCASPQLAVSNQINMSVSSNLTVGVSISPSVNPLCTGVPVTFTAIPVNAGALPVFTWKVNGIVVGTNSSLYSYLPTDGDIVTCTLLSSITCATNNPTTSNPVTMVVSSNLPVGITITGSENPICLGDSVTFTAIPLNGGVTPVYQWIHNLVNAGTNTSTFTCAPLNGDIIQCNLTSSNLCATGNPAVSNQITMTVEDYQPVTVSIAVSANPVCQGTSVTFIATAANAGASPNYQWQVNGANVGTNQSTFTCFPLNGNVVRCILTSSLLCTNNSPDTSNAITMTVYPVVPAGITISASANPVCTGTQVTYTATSVNAGNNPSYQWKINGVNYGGNSSIFIYLPSSGDVITCQLTSNLMCVSNNPITSDPITMVVASALPVSLTISASSNPFCQGSMVTFYSYANNKGLTPTYQWKVNGVPTGTNTTYSYTPNNGDYVTCAVTSSLSCATNNPAPSNPILMVVNTNTTVAVAISASANPVCQGTPVTFTSVVTNGGNVPFFQWKVNGGTVIGTGPTCTYTPLNGDVITCSVTSNAGCVYGNPAVSNLISMTVSSALPASVTITASNNPFCLGTVVNFTASPSIGGSAPIYQWRVNGITMGSGATFSYSPVNDDTVTCQMTSNATCITGTNPVLSNELIMNEATTIPVSVTITESANPVCQGTAVTFTASAINPGFTPQYQWKVNNNPAGTSNPTFTYTPANGDVVKCIMTSSLTCASGNPATSNTVTMTVNTPSPVSVTITASSNPVCIGTTETFTAVVVNGGSNPVYKWRVNGIVVGSNSSTYAYIPLNGDVVTCEVFSNAYCVSNNPALSNQITITVRTEQPVSVTIVASENPFCAGNQVTFTATPVNGGTAPIYDWIINGDVVLTGSSDSYNYQPNDNDTVICKLTSNQACICNNPDTSNVIIMHDTTGIPVSVTIVASMNPICAGTEIFFTATPVNGGAAPYYTWRVNGIPKVPHAPTYSYTPNNGDIITCVMTSNHPCALPATNPDTSNAIMMTVYPQNPVSISISASQNPVCEGSPVTFTANVVNGGTSPFYRWRVNGGNAGTNSSTFTYIPVNGQVVHCNLTSNILCPVPNYPINSNYITMSVVSYTPASVTIVPSANPVCQGTPVTFTATPINAGLTPYYQWKVNGVNVGINSSTYSYTPQNGDLVKCNVTSSAICTSGIVVSSNTVTVSVSPILNVNVTISTLTNPVCEGNTVVITALPQNGGTLPVYQWLLNGNIVGGNTSTYSFVPVHNDSIECILTSNAACTSVNTDTSNVIGLEVIDNLPVSVVVTPSVNPACQGQLITYTATGTNGGSSPGYDWMVNNIIVGLNSSTYSYYPNSGDTIICIYTSNINCPTGNPAMSDPLIMTFHPFEAVSVSITSSANPSCQGSLVLFTASTENAGATPFYQWKVNGVNVGSSLSTYSYIPINGDVVSCVLTSSVPCPISNPVASNSITMNVLQPLTAGISISTPQNPVCAGSNVTFTTITQNPGSSPTYTWKVNGIIAGGNQPTFSYVPANNDEVTCQLTSSITCIANSPISSNAITMSVVTDMPANISIVASNDTACTGQLIHYTATSVNGGSNPVYQWIVNDFNVGSDTTSYSYVPSHGDVVKCQMISSFSCASNNPALSVPITMTVMPIQPVGISITSSFNPACTGVPVTFTANPINAGTSPSYQWKVNGVNAGANASTYSFAPNNGDIVACQVNSSLLCKSGNPAMSNPITMIIGSSFPVSVTVAPSANPVCEFTVVTFTATPTNGGTIPFYQWKINGVNVGGNSTSYTYTPENNDIVTCVLTSNYSCGFGNPATSNPITMLVIPTPIGISIDMSPLVPVCAGTNVTFVATPSNGGPNPAYQWKVNGFNAGPNDSIFSYTPANGDNVFCVLTSSATCASGNTVASNSLTASVIPLSLVNNVITVDPSGSVCDGSTVNFTSFPTNGGSNPYFQWQVNGLDVGTNSPFYSYSPEDEDEVICLLTSNAICPSTVPFASNMIAMNVDPLMPVDIFVTANPSGPVCAGTTITFTATGFNGGPAPSYTWKVNGVVFGDNNPIFSYQPSHGDVVFCEYGSNTICPTGNPAISDPITMIVNPILPVGVSVANVPLGSICAGTTVTYTATSVNGGASPVYDWKVNGLAVGNNSDTYIYAPSNNDIITCTLTSNALCPSGNPAASSPITMTVDPLLPVTIAISGVAGDSVCAGTTVNFTSSILNGGSNPAYQWKVNGIDVGTASSFAYVPADDDQITCTLTSSELCTTANPVTSDTITMLVNNLNPVSISVSASPAGSVCAGNFVNFSATTVNSGNNPQYQWKVNGFIAGGNNSTFSYPPLDGDMVVCEINSNINCPQGNPASCNTITMTVNPLVPTTVSISADPTGPVCEGTSVTFTALPVNGGSTPDFVWKVNGVTAGSNSPVHTYVPNSGDVISCIMTSNDACAIGNPATSNLITMTVNPLKPVSVTINASPSSNVCSGTLVTFTASSVNGGSNPSYQWYVNGMSAGVNHFEYSFVPVNGEIITCQLTSNENCPLGNPANSNPIPMSVNPILPVSISITASPAEIVCDGTLVTYTASGQNEGSNPLYQWKVNGIIYGSNAPVFSYIPTNGDIVTCTLTSSEICESGSPATSNQIIMVVNPLLPVSIFVSASPTGSICAGTVVTYSALAFNGGLNPTYQWKVNGTHDGFNSSIFSYVPQNGDIITCELLSDAVCPTGNPALSLPLTMTVNPLLPVSIQINASANPVCEGNLVTYSAAPVNEGMNPIYEWKVNGITVGLNAETYSYLPNNGDIITCKLLSSEVCATGNPATSSPVIMTVNPNQPVSITVISSANPVCAGTTVTFTENTIHGGSSPIYSWKVNGMVAGSNSSTYLYEPNNGDIVMCEVTSNATCAIGNPAVSNSISMEVNPVLPVSVVVSATANPVCDGITVTYTSIAVNVGTSPIYHWTVNGSTVGISDPSFSYSPVNGDVVMCDVTSSEICTSNNPASSTPISMTVHPNVPVSISILSSGNSLCEGTQVTFTATPNNPGALPAYQWLVNGVNEGTNNPVFNFSPANNDAITCHLSTDHECPSADPAVSNTLIMVMLPVPYVGLNMCILQTSRDGKPFTLRGGVPTGGTYSGTGVTSGKFHPDQLPIGENSSVIKYVYNSTSGCKDSVTQIINVAAASAFSCGDNILDIRDNKSYPTVAIGSQCWFIQNLDFGTQTSITQAQRDNCSFEKYCYENISSNCSYFGGLYQWDEMMQYETEASGQGFCPPGWHIPSETEWSQLFATLSDNGHAGTALKPGGTSGFNALMGGAIFNFSTSSLKDNGTLFWSSTSSGPSKAWSHGTHLENTGVSTYSSLKSNAFYIRCIKD